jgi:hypothetical protein
VVLTHKLQCETIAPSDIYTWWSTSYDASWSIQNC